MSDNFSICRMCGAEQSVQNLPVREMMFGSGEEFLYEVCSICQSLQIKEIPEDLGRHYPEKYEGWSQRNGRNLKSKLRDTLVKITLRAYFSNIRPLRDVVPSPTRGDLLALAAAKPKKAEKILDVGCGKNPFFLILLSELGFDSLTGADPFAEKEECYFGRVRLQKKFLHEVTGTFDIITLNHSLEHTADPQSELFEIAKKLNFGGRAIVRIPTPSSAAYEKYGADWVQLDAPRHLNLPSRKAMQEMVEKAGLKILISFDDSGELQFYGSELFRRGIALSSPTARNEFTKDEMNEFRKEAAKLNRQDRGDQVCYILTN